MNTTLLIIVAVAAIAAGIIYYNRRATTRVRRLLATKPGDYMSVADIADKLNLHSSTVWHAIVKLGSRKLVDYTGHERNGYAKWMSAR